MGNLDDSSLCDGGSGDSVKRTKRRHRRKKISSACTITPAYELEEPLSDEADKVRENYLQKTPVSFGLECAGESKGQKKKNKRRKKCEDATRDDCADVKSKKFDEKYYLSLNHHTQISDDAIHAHDKHKKHKTMENTRNSESDDNAIKDAPCFTQCEQAQTDVEKENQTIAQLGGCGKMDDIALKSAEKCDSSLNHHALICGGTVEAHQRHKKQKKVTVKGFESDGYENKAVPYVEKEDQAIAELEECKKIDGIAVERRKQKKNKACDAKYTSCADEIDILFSDKSLSSTSGRLHKKKYRPSIGGHAQATNESAVSGIRENGEDKCAFSVKSDRVVSDAGNSQNCTLQTPHKKKRREVAKEHFQEGTSCSLSDQRTDECENNETCRSIDDGQWCSAGAACKKKTRKLKLTVNCADGSSDCAISSSTAKPSDNASFIDAAGGGAQMGHELEKRSEMGSGTSRHELGESPLSCNDGDCITEEHSSTQKVLGAALKKKKRKLARLSTFGSEFFYTDPLQADADSSEAARKSSKGDEEIAPKNNDTVPSVGLGSASKNMKLHGQDTPGASCKILSSAESSHKCSEHTSQSLKAALHGHQRSHSPPDPDFLAYVNGEHRFPSIHHKTKPSLETIRRYEEETGLAVYTGKYTAEEDFILLKNIHEIAKYYSIVYPHMIVGHCGEQDPALQKEVKDLVRKEQLIRLLGRGLPHRTIHSAYMRARILLDPLSTAKNLALTPKQKERLEQLYNQLGPKWTVMAQKMGLPAEQLRSAFRYVKEKETFATGKWEKSEDELLKQAVERQTRGSSARLKDINWQAVSQYVRSRNALQCRRHWTLTQLTPPPGQEMQKWDSMHKLNASRSAEVDWEAVGNSFPWAPSPLVAKYHWESTLNYYLPPGQRGNFKSKVKNLYEIALPSLLEKYGKGKTLEEIIELSKSATA